MPLFAQNVKGISGPFSTVLTRTFRPVLDFLLFKPCFLSRYRRCFPAGFKGVQPLQIQKFF